MKLTIWNIRSRLRSRNFDFRVWVTRKVPMARMNQKNEEMRRSLEIKKSRELKLWPWRTRIKGKAIRRPESAILKMVRRIMNRLPAIKSKRTCSGKCWIRCRKTVSLIDWGVRTMSKKVWANQSRLKIWTLKFNKKNRKMMNQAKLKSKPKTSKIKIWISSFQMKI